MAARPRPALSEALPWTRTTSIIIHGSCSGGTAGWRLLQPKADTRLVSAAPCTVTSAGLPTGAMDMPAREGQGNEWARDRSTGNANFRHLGKAGVWNMTEDERAELFGQTNQSATFLQVSQPQRSRTQSRPRNELQA